MRMLGWREGAGRSRTIAIALVATTICLFSVPALAGAQGPVRPDIVVNSMADAVDSSAGDGVCRTTGGQCTLRAAVIEANALLGHDRIRIPAGVYEIEIPVLNEDLPGT